MQRNTLHQDLFTVPQAPFSVIRRARILLQRDLHLGHFGTLNPIRTIARIKAQTPKINPYPQRHLKIVFGGECFLSMVCPQTTRHSEDDWEDGNKNIIAMVTLQDWRMFGHYFLPNAKAHAPRSAGAGDGRGVEVVAWGRHENWAADRGCHAASCSWKEIPRKRGGIHGRSSPNPLPAQVTKPAPRRIGGTQAHKQLLRGIGAHHQKPCHIQL